MRGERNDLKTHLMIKTDAQWKDLENLQHGHVKSEKASLGGTNQRFSQVTVC